MRAITIALSAQKGGVGKSTSSITISSYLARQGYKTLIIDLDGQCNTTGILLGGYSELKEIETVASMLSKDFETLARSVIKKTNLENLDIIPSHPRLSEAETLMNDLPVRESRLKYLIEGIKEDYDFIIIDCPPNINMLPVNAWTASDYLIIPLQPSVFDLQGLSLLLDKIAITTKFYNPKLQILGYLVTMFDSRNNMSHVVYSTLLNRFGNKLFRTKIPMNTAIQKAHANKIDITGYAPFSNSALAYKGFIEKELLPKVQKIKLLNTTL